MFLNDAVLRAFEQSCPRSRPCALTSPATWARSAPCVARPRPLPRGHGARGAQGKGGGGVELLENDELPRPPRCARFDPASLEQLAALSPRTRPCAARRARTTACSPSTTSAWTRPRASTAASSRATAARRARARSTRPRPPCRTSTSTGRAGACSATSRCPPTGRRRQRGHPARAQPVRELPVLVHVLHEAGLPRGAVRPVQKKTYEAGIESMPSESVATRPSFPMATS